MTTVFQHGTLGMLMEGVLGGTITFQEVLKHGDTGIGTLEGINGEVIVLDGEVYQAEPSGKINHITDLATTMPFTTMTFIKENAVPMQLGATNGQGLNEFAMEHGMKNVFASFKLHGTFPYVKVRIAPGSKPPYPTLAEIAANQPEFEREQVVGTLVGFFSPALYEGVTAAGWHLHFLSDDHEFGGHLLDCVTGDLEGVYQIFDDFDLHLPINDAAFRGHDQNLDGLAAGIKAAEGME
ncbi:MAG: acetolactate decarboxylase [Lactobacillaceae bacterium]|jgi:acetolactate decarboxylase|nr:acetolactate decarboxylase [Lactobacillaceae bacterium]